MKHTQLEQQIETEKIAKLYSSLPLGSSSIILLVIINGITLSLQQTNIELFIWIAAVITLVAVRLISYQQHKYNQHSKTNQYWLVLYYIYSTLSGALWGYAIFNIMPDNISSQQIILIISVAGLISGCSSTLALAPMAFLSYMIVTIVPLSFKLYFSIPEHSFLLGSFCYVYMFFMWRTCLQNNDHALNNIIKTFSLKVQQQQLEQAQRKLNLQLKSSPLAIIDWNTDLAITHWNPAAEQLFQYDSETIKNHNINDLMSNETAIKHLEKLQNKQSVLAEIVTCKTNSAKTITCEWTSAPLLDENHELVGFTSFVKDVTEHVQREAMIIKKAFYDELTGLPNRHYFKERLQQELLRVKRYNHYSAVFFIDLDHFKQINDSLGHDMGDVLLIEFSQRIQQRIRKQEVASRFGGDEFILLLEDLDQDKLAAQLSAKNVAESIADIMKKPFHLSGRDYYLGCSIGIAIFNSNNYTQDELLKQADLALYESKRRGRNTYSFFKQAMNSQVEIH